MSRNALVETLRKATREERVSVEFSDGKKIEGAILFNEMKGCGKVINVDAEISIDFRIDQIRSIRL